MYYIHTLASITHQNSFQQENVWDNLTVLENNSVVIAPDYKLYISPVAIRRLSPVLRMAIAAAKECQQTTSNDFDSISVGTALGCLLDTEKFLNTFHSSTSDTLSPTAFIQSTHNTIAGQISLELKNHSYNMTHTQNSLSFEVALLDAMLCCLEGKSNVLLGAADEAIDFLKVLQPTIIKSELQFTSGASFFVLSQDQSESAIGFKACECYFSADDVLSLVTAFVKKQGLSIEEIDQVFISGKEYKNDFLGAIDYLDFSGLHYSASAFAVHLAHDWLKKHKKSYALIINEQIKGKLGLILMKRDEA